MNSSEIVEDAIARLLEKNSGLRGWAIERLHGGNNNRTFLARSAGGTVVVKHYHHDARDPRDRLHHEFAFARYAWASGVRAIPRPIASDPTNRLALYEYIEGDPLAPGGIGDSEIDAALRFVDAINRNREGARELPRASEACSTLVEHLAMVERRIDRLQVLDPAAPAAADAAALVATRLVPAFKKLSARTVERAAVLGVGPGDRLANAAHCISPSDFGFHNALRRGNGDIVFLDFEYSGWDDPAKLACDFFCQPAVPVPYRYFEGFIESLAQMLKLEARDVDRIRLLIDIYRLRWVCIMLNVFLPIGAARWQFAAGESLGERCALQLSKARAALGELLATGG